MKTLIIYYSLDGHTRFAAEKIAAVSGGDLLEIKTVKQLTGGNISKYFWGGKQVLTGAKPEILPFSKNPADYDLIFIGTPVWAASYAPALKTFFSQTEIKDKKVALFLTCDGMPGKTFTNLKKALAGNEILGELSLVSPFKNLEGSTNKIKNWLINILK